VIKSIHSCKQNHNSKLYHLIRAETVLMTEQCNFHKTESNAITFSVMIVALSFSEVTDKVLRAN